jgi:hypothetical protein
VHEDFFRVAGNFFRQQNAYSVRIRESAPYSWEIVPIGPSLSGSEVTEHFLHSREIGATVLRIQFHWKIGGAPMGQMACALVLALTGMGFARQQSSPLASTPPTVSQERTSERQTAPGQAAQSSEELTTPEVQQIIHDHLSSEPALAGTSLSVRTDDRAIVLMGGVGSERQHEAALRIAQSFTGGRQIVDKIKIRGIASE